MEGMGAAENWTWIYDTNNDLGYPNEFHNPSINLTKPN